MSCTGELFMGVLRLFLCHAQVSCLLIVLDCFYVIYRWFSANCSINKYFKFLLFWWSYFLCFLDYKTILWNLKIYPHLLMCLANCTVIHVGVVLPHRSRFHLGIRGGLIYFASRTITLNDWIYWHQRFYEWKPPYYHNPLTYWAYYWHQFSTHWLEKKNTGYFSVDPLDKQINTHHCFKPGIT